MSKADERILVIPRTFLFGNDEEEAFEGVRGDEAPLRALSLLSRHGQLARRGDMETNPAYKQPIPYVVLLREQADGTREVYTYERLQGGGEARLHNRLSVGVGGHMNELLSFSSPAETIRAEAEREVEEELIIHSRPRSTQVEVVGLLNTDRDEVGTVHVGLVCLLRLPAGCEVEVREHDALRGYWASPESLLAPDTEGRLETWSHLTLEFLAAQKE